jgi:hypothetical protein
MKSKDTALLVTALLVGAIGYWAYLVFAAHYSSTHNLASTSQAGAFHDLLFSSACVLAFIATGVSLWHHRTAAVILRVFVAVLSILGAVFTVRGALDTFATLGASSLHPIPFFTGLFLLCGYFITTFITTLPFVSAERAIELRFLLHFGIFPAAIFAIFVLGIPRDYYMTFSAFGIYLVGGIPFILLSFRMYELRRTFNHNG